MDLKISLKIFPAHVQSVGLYICEQRFYSRLISGQYAHNYSLQRRNSKMFNKECKWPTLNLAVWLGKLQTFDNKVFEPPRNLHCWTWHPLEQPDITPVCTHGMEVCACCCYANLSAHAFVFVIKQKRKFTNPNNLWLLSVAAYIMTNNTCSIMPAGVMMW